MGSRHLRAGQMDAGTADAQLRHAVRSLQQLFSRADARSRPAGADTQPDVPAKPRWPAGTMSSPRLGSAYDLFGDGKTALKVSLNKYVIAQGLQGTYGDTANPVNRLANIVTRSWIDGNRQLRARLRSDQSLVAGFPECRRRSVWHRFRRRTSADRRSASITTREVLNGLGRAPVSMGVLGERATRNQPRHVGRCRVLPPLVRQLRDHRQPQSWSGRLQQVRRYGSARPHDCPMAAATR